MQSNPLSSILVLLCLITTGCEPTRTEWKVQANPSAICGIGIFTEWQAEWRSVENTATALSLIMADQRFWTEYFNQPDDKNPVSLKDIRITPGRLTNDLLAECTLSFQPTKTHDEETLRDRFLTAVTRYVADDKRAKEQNAIASLKIREAAILSKQNEESPKLLAIIRQRLTAAQTQIRDDHDTLILKVFIHED